MDPKPIQIGATFTEFPGGSFNALVRNDTTRRAAPPNTPGLGRGLPSYVQVACHNSTSGNIAPGEILGFSAPIFTLEQDGNQVYSAPNVKGITPAVPTHSSQFVVALDFIRGTGDVTGGAVGPAVLQGLAWCKVNWTDEAHEKVKVAEGETMLQSGSSGITPVWHEEIPDPEYLPATLWALVKLGGGESGSVSTQFGLVITEAAKDGGLPGTYLALDKDMVPLDANGEPFEFDVTDPMDDYYDEYAIEDAEIEFYSAHVYAPCTEFTRIHVTIVDDKHWGEMVDVVDYLATRTNFAEKKILYVPEGGTVADDIDWYGTECETET